MERDSQTIGDKMVIVRDIPLQDDTTSISLQPPLNWNTTIISIDAIATGIGTAVAPNPCPVAELYLSAIMMICLAKRLTFMNGLN